MTPAEAALHKLRHYEAIERAAIRRGLPVDLVKAICRVESDFDTYAMRFEPAYRWLLHEWKPLTLSADDPMRKPAAMSWTEFVAQKTSWGLMQVMGAVAREKGFGGPLSSLCYPEYGLLMGCSHLSRFIDRFGEDGGIEAYNAGRPGTAAGARYLAKVKAAREEFSV